MKHLPDLLFVTNRGHLIAYRPADTGHLEVIDSLEPMEGNVKISDLVTDQAGAFPTGGAGTAAYENLPLTEELKLRSLRKIAAKMEEILEREQPGTWGFAAAPEINGAIIELLPRWCGETHTINLKLDLTNSPPAEVKARFEKQG